MPPAPSPQPSSAVRLVVRDARGHFRLILVKPQAAWLEHPGSMPTLQSHQLLTGQLIASSALASHLWHLQPTRVADPLRLIGLGIRRVNAPDEKIPGEVNAIRGASAIRLGAGGPCLIVRDMLEIVFHRKRLIAGREEMLPPLTSSDFGRLVVSTYDEVIGLIVAGSDYKAIVAPLDKFLGLSGWTVVDPSDYDGQEATRRGQQKLAAAADCFFDDLATTPPFPLGDPLGQAA